MAHQYNVLEVFELVLGVWGAGPVIVLIWVASPALIDFFKRLLVLREKRHDHTTATYHHH